MKQEVRKNKTYLILSMRHLGDAVVVAGFINALSEQCKNIEVDVVGRGELKGVTDAFCTVREYISIDLPMFGHHRRNAAAFLDAIRKILLLRNRKYDWCINLMGDMRENLVGHIVGAKEVIAPVWQSTHLFRRHIRIMQSPPRGSGVGEIPSSIAGYYASIEYFAQQLGLRGLCWPKLMINCPQQEKRRVVGIHPGASHPSKQWPAAKWRELIQVLVRKEYSVRIYGSPSEAAELHTEYHAEIANFGLEVAAGEMPSFLQSLLTSDLLVCMDSFSSHAAHAVGIPAVVLHGPFDPSVMTPPTGIPLSAGSMCGVFPCYNGRSCKNTDAKYICVQGIEVKAVVEAVEAMIGHIRARK
jgi:ADP-heptose:LPS heptosyltransferase